MRKFTLEFIRRGAMACGIGPIVLAIIYLTLYVGGEIETLSVPEVCIGILSISALAFIAGGMSSVYQIERLPLMAAISIHGFILYVSYLATYLINGWLDSGLLPMLVFTVIFVVGFILIWAIIYSVIKRNTEKINKILEKK